MFCSLETRISSWRGSVIAASRKFSAMRGIDVAVNRWRRRGLRGRSNEIESH